MTTNAVKATFTPSKGFHTYWKELDDETKAMVISGVALIILAIGLVVAGIGLSSKMRSEIRLHKSSSVSLTNHRIMLARMGTCLSIMGIGPAMMGMASFQLAKESQHKLKKGYSPVSQQYSINGSCNYEEPKNITT